MVQIKQKTWHNQVKLSVIAVSIWERNQWARFIELEKVEIIWQVIRISISLLKLFSLGLEVVIAKLVTICIIKKNCIKNSDIRKYTTCLFQYINNIFITCNWRSVNLAFEITQILREIRKLRFFYLLVIFCYFKMRK